MLEKLDAFIDNLTGVQGSAGYIYIVVLSYLGYSYMNSGNLHPAPAAAPGGKEEEEDPPELPRNFTSKQLAYFDGTKEDRGDEDKPVYLSVNGIVFDVSDGRNFYGPDGPYEAFAGHECGVALAKMSFDTEHLDDLEGCQTLNFGEKTELEGWIEKFTYYRNYPIKGKLVPDKVLDALKDRLLTTEDLAQYTGSDSNTAIPEGYATQSIYIGAGNYVFDVSFGGLEFYGPGCGYHRFAGKDASRALAKMSFEPDDITNTDVSDLEDKQKKVMWDWIKTFQERKKYPIVGKLGKDVSTLELSSSNK